MRRAYELREAWRETPAPPLQLPEELALAHPPGLLGVLPGCRTLGGPNPDLAACPR